MIDTQSGTARLLDFIPDQVLPSMTLLELTGDASKIVPERRASGLQRRVGVAWRKPLDGISCGECRMLMGQRFGIEWLAAAIAVFVARYPHAECDLYPGDLSVNALIGWRDLHRHTPSEVTQMLKADFRWLDVELAKDLSDNLMRKAWSSLEAARRELGV